jgi:hypothetical protein
MTADAIFRSVELFLRGRLFRFSRALLRPAAPGSFRDLPAALRAKPSSTATSFAAIRRGRLASANFAKSCKSALDGSSLVLELRDDFPYVSHSVSLIGIRSTS